MFIQALIKNIFIFIFVFQVLYLPIYCDNKQVSEERTPFFIVSIPKSGTHLVLKLLSMMLEAEEKWIHIYFPDVDSFTFSDMEAMKNITEEKVEEVMKKLYDEKSIPFTHTNFSEPLLEFSKNHSEYVSVLVIRDLRDVIISWAFFREKWFNDSLGPLSIQERIKFILSNEKGQGFFRFIEKALLWLNKPDTVILRFEDLVGGKGKGSDSKQQETILHLADKLNVDLDIKQLNSIRMHLFGKDEGSTKFTTFKSGQIGTWKEYFDKELLELFNQKLAYLQVALGYSLD